MARFLFYSKMFHQLRNSAASDERSDNCVKLLAESMEGFMAFCKVLFLSSAANVRRNKRNSFSSN